MRHEIHTVVGLEARRHTLRLGRVLEDPQPVPEPLHRGARDEHRALERERQPALRAAGRGRQQSVRGGHDPVSRVHEQKGTRSVGVLGQPARPAALSEERSLLVPGNASHRGFDSEAVAPAHSEVAAARSDLGEEGGAARPAGRAATGPTRRPKGCRAASSRRSWGPWRTRLRRSSARPATCRSSRPPARPPPRGCEARDAPGGATGALCRRSTGPEPSRCGGAPPARARPPEAPDTGQPCAGPARRWPGAPAPASRGPTTRRSPSGW